MTSKEFDLLTFLVGHAGEVFTRSELLDQVWRSSPSWQSPATVTEHVYRLRSKIEDVPNSPRVLCTVRGLGYRLVPPPVTEALKPRPRSGTGIQVGTRIVAVDAGALALFVADDPSEVIGRDIFDFVAPVSRPSARSRRTMRAEGKSPLDQLIMLRCLDGTEVMVRVSTEMTDFAGDPALRVTLHEVLDHRLGLMPDIGVDDEVDIDDAVIVTDTDFHVLSWSRGAEQLYGWLEPEVLGHSLDNLARAHDHVETVDPPGGAGEPLRWGDVVPLAARNGSVVAARVSMQPHCGPDGLIDGMVLVHHVDRDAAPANSVLAGAGSAGIR
jgi:PAS domain S-box-containing protein